MQNDVLFPSLQDNDDSSGMSQQLKENFARLRKRTAKNRPQLALETAVMVDEEVKRLKASIAELERLLEPSEDDPPPREVTVVPVVTPDDDDDDESTTKSSS